MENGNTLEYSSELDPIEKTFLEERYLHESHLIPDDIRQTMEEITSNLGKKFPDKFKALTLVGGTANGSFILRRMMEKNPATDVDFYLVGDGAGKNDLEGMSREVRRGLEPIHLTPDPTLNGKNERNFLNLSQLEEHIANEDFDLLALPFGAVFGSAVETRQAVLEAVKAHPNRDQIWTGIREYHAQGLSMHHGKWSDDFNDLIREKYYPEKVKIFGLPEKIEAYEKMTHES